MEKKKKSKTSNKLLVVSVIMIVLFTAAAIALQFFTSVELSSTLITCWYAFWTVEIYSMARIKITKVKHKYTSPEDIIDEFLSSDEEDEEKEEEKNEEIN